jgi:hypothetical protein
MATLPPSLQLLARQDIIDQRLTLDQIQEAETTAVTRWLVSRLDNPEGRPRSLERGSTELLLSASKRMAVRAAIAPDGKLCTGLHFALDYLRRATRTAALAYPDLDLSALQPIQPHQHAQLVSLSDDQVNHLRATRLWLNLLVKTAPKAVAVELLRACDWLEWVEREATAEAMALMAEYSPEELKS